MYAVVEGKLRREAIEQADLRLTYNDAARLQVVPPSA